MEEKIQNPAKIRRQILDIVYHAGSGHIGGDLSVCDILNILYGKYLHISPALQNAPERDRFILSKGHCVEALYSVLHAYGYLSKEDLLSVGQFGSHLIGHPHNSLPGIEMNSGSLGHGLSLGVGMALSFQKQGLNNRVFVVMGDGELAEGSVWEGAMAAGHYRLSNLTAIVDRNGLQISGPTEDVMCLEPLEARWRSFGWRVIEANGNDYDSLDMAFAQSMEEKMHPCVILAHTIKGYGISFMENQAVWHHKIPSAAEYEAACNELLQKEASAP